MLTWSNQHSWHSTDKLMGMIKQIHRSEASCSIRCRDRNLHSQPERNFTLQKVFLQSVFCWTEIHVVGALLPYVSDFGFKAMVGPSWPGFSSCLCIIILRVISDQLGNEPRTFHMWSESDTDRPFWSFSLIFSSNRNLKERRISCVIIFFA